MSRKFLKIFERIGAIIANNHFVYASGKHGSAYFNKNAVYCDTEETSRLCRAIAEQFAGDNIELVIGPETGGIVLSQWTAYHFSKINKRKVISVYIANIPKFYALASAEFDAWEAPCPLCEQNIPINTEFGKGNEFLAKKSR